MTSLFNIFSSLDDSINQLTGNSNIGNDSVRKYGQHDSLHHTSLHQGKQFRKYQEKIVLKNQKKSCVNDAKN